MTTPPDNLYLLVACHLRFQSGGVLLILSIFCIAPENFHDRITYLALQQ